MNIKSNDLEINFKQLIAFSPLTIQSTCSVAEALRLITSQAQGNNDFSDINSVLVTAQQKLVGRMSVQQILALCAQGETLETLAVEAMMLPREPTVYESELSCIARVLDQLQQNQTSEIAVINDQDEVVGVLNSERVWHYLAKTNTLHLKQQLAAEKFLNEISQAIHGSLNIQEVLHLATQRSCTFLGSDRALIYQYSAQGKGRVASETTLSGEVSPLPKELSIFENLENNSEDLASYRQGDVQVISDVCESNVFFAQQLINAEIKAVIIAPIVCSGKLWGVFSVSQQATPRQWTTEEVKVVKQVAQQCAIAIQQALIHRNLRREVTKRKKGQRHLENQQQQLLNIANSIPGGIYQFSVSPNGEWSFPFANQGALNLFGIPADVDFSVAQHWLDRIHPEDLQKVNNKIEMALCHKTRWQCEFRVVRADSIRWVEGIADIPEQREDNSVVFNGVVLDTTERKNAENGWRTLVEASKNFSSKNFLASVVEYIANTLDVHWVMVSQKEGNAIQSKAIWGKGKLQPNVKLSLTDDSPCVDIIRFQYHNGLIYQDNVQDNFPNNELLKAADAKVYIGVPLLNLQEEVVGNLCIFHRQPLTGIDRIKAILNVFADRIAAELERTEALANLQAFNQDLEKQVAARTVDLAKRNQELDSFFSVSLDLLCIADLKGYFRHLNRRWEEILGYSLDELKTQPWFNFIHPEDQAATQEALRCLQQDQPVKYFINRYRCADSSYRWLEWSAVRVGEKIYAAAHDVTRRKQDQEYLEQTNAELERANRLKDEFLANMSHEFRTPLNSILGLTEGLKEQAYGSLNPRQLKNLDTIHSSGTHLLELINDILDLSKIEAGKLELDINPISLQHLCDSALSLVREMAQRKQITLKLELPQQLPTIRGDEQRLRQALLNLLSNAIKFTPPEGKITLQVASMNQGAEIAFSVIDTGIGIDEKDLPELFQPFMQLQTQLTNGQPQAPSSHGGVWLTQQRKGTGLGLSLVKRIAELHSGKVRVESTLAQGSCFTIIVPYTQEQSDAIDLKSEKTSQDITSTQSSDPSGPLAKILIADDDEANLLTIRSYLEAKGYPIVVATNGRSAVNLARQEQPDIVLMDIQMPELDGLEAIRQLRAQPYSLQTPIIALTAFAMSGDQEKCLLAGADHYLTKPVRLRNLLNTIQRMTEG